MTTSPSAPRPSGPPILETESKARAFVLGVSATVMMCRPTRLGVQPFRNCSGVKVVLARNDMAER